MQLSIRRGGVGRTPGRALVRAGVFCLVASGCATDPPPALLTLIDAERMVLQDSELIPDSAKAAIRTYMGRLADSVWQDVQNPDLDRIVGECRGLTAVLNPDALPQGGRAERVIVDVPGIGSTEFRVARVRSQSAAETYTGQADDGQLSILLLRDSAFAGRITTVNGVFSFRSGRYGLIEVEPVTTSRTLPQLHLLPARPVSGAAVQVSSRSRPTVAAGPDTAARSPAPSKYGATC